jgi:glyoxylase-like metal-dependent hydrolase (beta-lactamase superfamily II)
MNYVHATVTHAFHWRVIMKWSFRAVIAQVVLCVAAGSATAQSSHQSTALKSQREGAAVLAAGLDAIGGLEAIRAVTTVARQGRMQRVQVGQSVRPGVAGQSGSPAYFRMTTEANSDRFMLEGFPDDTLNQPVARVVGAGDDLFIHRIPQNQVQDVDPAPLQPFLRAMPFVPGLLLEAWDRLGTVRSLGSTVMGGTAYDVITYADAVGSQVALYFDRRTKLPTRSEILQAHDQFGDAVVEALYADYRRVGNLHVPWAVTVETAGMLSSTTEYDDVVFNPGLDESLMVRPEGVPAAPGTGGPAAAGDAFALSEVQDGVYLISDVTPQYNVMFVEQEEQVVVIEAPGGGDVTKRVLEIVHETVPGKPVKLILTHHHFDHTAGLWKYLQKGIPVVAPAGHEEFVRTVATAPRRLAGVMHMPPLEIEAVTGGRSVVGSGAERIELIDVGPNPHVDEILIAYMPEHKLMWVADIYGYGPGFTPPPLLLSFADKMDELNLDIETILTAHTPPGTIEEYRDYVRQTRESN